MKKTKILLVGALLFGVPSVALSVNHQFNNATVVRAETHTATMTNFTSIASNNIGGDTNVSYSCAKGGGTAAPISKDGEIRLYQNPEGNGGGTITIKSVNGCVLTSVTIGSSMKTSIAYTINNETTKSTTKSLAANDKSTVNLSDKSVTSITFYCMGTSSSTRLYVNYLSATYDDGITHEGNKVVFNSDGGTKIENQYIESGKTIEKPVDPKKDGYKFSGWFYNDKEWDFSTIITEPITLIAKWNNLDVSSISSCTIADSYYRITGKLTSNYANKSYSIQDSTGAIVLYDTNSILNENIVNSTISITGKLSKNIDDNLQLEGLIELENSENNVTIESITNINLISSNDYAKYVSLKNIKIKSISNQEATINKSDLISLYYDTKTYISNYDSKTFNSLFSVDSYINIEGFVNIVNSKLKICLTKISKSTTYTATFVYNNGSANTTQIVSEEEKFTRPENPTKDADSLYTYSFDNWYTEANGKGEIYNFDNEPKDITLYANWIATAKPINETFKDVELKSNLKFGYTKNMVNASDETYVFTSDSNSGDKMINGTIISYQKGALSAPDPKYYDGGLKLYYKTSLTIKNDELFEKISIKVNSETKLSCKYDIDVIGASFDYDSENKLITLTPTSNTIELLFGQDKTKGNIQISSLTTIGGKVASYSNFNSLQLQYQYSFDVSNAKDVEEVGIYVTDDTTFDFATTGKYDDQCTFNSKLKDNTHGHTFVNKDKLATYTVGINIPEINLSTTGTTFKACAYVKTNGKYYFAGNFKTLTIKSMLKAYVEMNDLNQEAKNVVNAFYDYLSELASK